MMMGQLAAWVAVIAALAVFALIIDKHEHAEDKKDSNKQ